MVILSHPVIRKRTLFHGGYKSREGQGTTKNTERRGGEGTRCRVEMEEPGLRREDGRLGERITACVRATRWESADENIAINFASSRFVSSRIAKLARDRATSPIRGEQRTVDYVVGHIIIARPFELICCTEKSFPERHLLFT